MNEASYVGGQDEVGAKGQMKETPKEHPRVLLAHPGRQHSYRLATALKKAGLLEKYITTVYYGKERRSLTRWAARFLRGDARSRGIRRVCQALDDSDVVTYFETLGLLTIVAYRIDPSGRLARLLERLTSWLFQRRVARYAIRHRVDAVIMYDCNARWCFEILARKAPEIIRILDHAHPVRNYLYEVYQQNLPASGEFVKTYTREPFLLDRRLAAKYGVEARTAEYHIVASSFSRDAVRFNGFADDRIILVPYGVDSQVFVPSQHQKPELAVLFVGEINQRKGIAQTLEAAKRLRGKGVRFVLVGGGREFHPDLYAPYEEFVTFMGRVSFDELVRSFGSADIFIFPSMGEGFGLVILEAMSAGLPVISSTNCVGGDVVVDYLNGFVIPAGDAEALAERIVWFSEHRSELEEMGLAARETALFYTWQRYEQDIVKNLSTLFQGAIQ